MNQSRFTLNALLVFVISFSASIFLVALIVPESTDDRIVNDLYPIEDTTTQSIIRASGRTASARLPTDRRA